MLVKASPSLVDLELAFECLHIVDNIATEHFDISVMEVRIAEKPALASQSHQTYGCRVVEKALVLETRVLWQQLQHDCACQH